MQMTAKFLSSKDPDEAKVKDLVNGLKGIYVKSFEFETKDSIPTPIWKASGRNCETLPGTESSTSTARRKAAVEVYLMHTAGAD